MSLSTEEYLEFSTNIKPTKILRFIAYCCRLEDGETDILYGAVSILWLQGFITDSTHDRYCRLCSRIKNKETTLRSRNE